MYAWLRVSSVGRAAMWVEERLQLLSVTQEHGLGQTFVVAKVKHQIPQGPRLQSPGGWSRAAKNEDLHSIQ